VLKVTAMTARYTQESPLEQVRSEFSKMFGSKIELLEKTENRRRHKPCRLGTGREMRRTKAPNVKRRLGMDGQHFYDGQRLENGEVKTVEVGFQSAGEGNVLGLRNVVFPVSVPIYDDS